MTNAYESTTDRDFASLEPDTDPASPESQEFSRATALVPVRERRDGWTLARQREFLATLSETGCVSQACVAVNKSAQSAYRLRRRPDAAAFDQAWDQALVFASQRLTAIAFERAINGVVEETVSNGEIVTLRRYPHGLLTFLLKSFDPTRYGKLSGITPFEVLDPREQARGALAAFGLPEDDFENDGIYGDSPDIAPGCDA